jgi:IS5 family transposase
MVITMLHSSPADSAQASFFDMMSQLDQSDPLLALSRSIPWSELETAFSPLYKNGGRGAKPIRLMCGLLMLKQLNNLSDEVVVEQWKQNPYFQAFCGETSFQCCLPCHSTELVKFRQRIGREGIETLFSISVKLHGEKAEEATVLVDTTVQEKAITYPTDTKLAIKIINRLNKLAKAEGIKQRRTYVKEVKELRLASRHFRHVKRRRKAKRALGRLRTIAGALKRELERKLPQPVLERESERFALYEKVLNQSRNDKDKIYSLHDPGVYCVGKGKDHKTYEYGRKASVVTTLKSQIIIGVESHDEHVHDSKTLAPALNAANKNRSKPIKNAVVDRGYRGVKKHVEINVTLPGKPLKRDSEKEKSRKRTLCRKRSAIEPIIGHLKHDFRLQRNWLQGSVGDAINLLMAACAWNLRKWMAAFFLPTNSRLILCVLAVLLGN